MSYRTAKRPSSLVMLVATTVVAVTCAASTVNAFTFTTMTLPQSPDARLNHPRRNVNSASNNNSNNSNKRTRLFATVPKKEEQHSTIRTGPVQSFNLDDRTNGLSRLFKDALEQVSGQEQEQKGDKDVNEDLHIPTFHTKVVSIDCRLRPVDFVPQPLFDGIVLNQHNYNHQGGEPMDPPMHRLTFALNGGNYLPELHELVFTMQRGEQAHDFPMDAGWGPRREDLAVTVNYQALLQSLGGVSADSIRVGTELLLDNGGAGATCVITDVDSKQNTVIIDSNPPLAGATYLADVNYLSSITLPRNRRGDIIVVESESNDRDENQGHPYQVATFALGCFWGAELAFMRHPGVVGTRVGYTQGIREDQQVTYEDVCSGTTGHAEAVQILYDSTQVTYKKLAQYAMNELLKSDKYRLNQVKNDHGSQYRHGLYYHNDEQRDIAQRLVHSYGPKCVTEVKCAATFYNAEPYHQQYLYKGGQSARKGDKAPIRCYG